MVEPSMDCQERCLHLPMRGYLLPHFSGSKVRRIHHKNRHRQDKKRHKLMGQDKKNGVDKLIQFLQDGSPHLHKRVPDKDMSGSASTHNSWRGINNPKTY